MPPPYLAFGIAGMPGSGKSVVGSVAASSGYEVYSMGDVVRQFARERGVEPSPEKLGELMLTIRSEGGPAVVASKTLERMRLAPPSRLCVEGLRSRQEVESFRAEFPEFFVVAVYSSPRTRFLRLTARERRDDPKSRSLFEERDRREIGVGLGEVLALADFAILNEGTLEELKSNAARIFQMAEIGVQTRN